MSVSRAGKIARGVGYAAAAVAGLALIVIVALLIPPVRGRILSVALSQANAHIPGTLSVRESRWDLPITLTINDLTWTDGPDTLLAAGRLRIAVRPFPLLRRDIEISSLSTEGLTGDVPAVRARLSQPESVKVAPAPSSGSRFPRAGSVPGIPSLSVERLYVTARSLRLSEKTSLRQLEAGGAIDFLHGGPPDARLDRLALNVETDGRTDGPLVDDASLEWDLDRGMIKGRASGRLSSDLPFFLSIFPTGEGTFDLVLAAREGEQPPQNVGLALTGTFERSGYRFTSLHYDAILVTPGTDELSRSPALATRLKGFGPLEGLLASLRGSLRVQPALAASLQADIHPNSWIEGGRIGLTYEEGEVSVDTLLVRLQDLEARAHGELSRETMSAQVALHVSGNRWLRTLRPGTGAPDSLVMDLTAQASGARTSPRIEAFLKASARHGRLTLDNLDLQAEVPGGEDRRALLSLEAHAMDMLVTANAALDLSGEPRAVLSPIVLHDIAAQQNNDPQAGPGPRLHSTAPHGGRGDGKGIDGAAGSAGGQTRPLGRGGQTTLPAQGGTTRTPTPGIAKYERETGVMVLDNVRVTGALGDLRLDGSLGRRGDGAYRIHWAWPEPPASLARVLSSTQMDSLRAAWATEEPLHVEIEGRMDPGGVAGTTESRAKLTLPGPRTLSALMPSGAAVDDLGPVRGNLHVKTLSTQGRHDYVILLDLDDTEWLDFGRAKLSSVAGVTAIDTLSVALEGVSIGLHGLLRDGQWDAHADLSLSDARLVRRFHSAAGESLDVKVTAEADLKGTVDAPRLIVSARGSAAAPGYRLPSFVGQARWDERGKTVKISAPDGLATETIYLTDLTATYDAGPESHGLTPGRVTLALRGEDLEFFQVAGIDNPDGWHIRTDTLALALDGRDLRNTSPFDLWVKPQRQMFAVTNLMLQGSLGKISAEGYSCPDSCSLGAEASVRLPQEPPFKGLPPGLWPDALDVRLSSTGVDNVSAQANVTGIDLGDRRDLEAHLDLSSIEQGITVRITVADGGDHLLESEASVPASITLYPPSASLNEGAIRLDATLSGFPAPLQDPLAGADRDRLRNASLDGRIALRGTTDAVSGYASARLSFPQWPKLSKYSLDLETQLAPESGADAGSQARPGGEGFAKAPAEQDAPGLSATFSFSGPKGELMAGTVSYPTALTLAPLALRPIEDREMEVRVDSDDLPLAEFDNILPPNIGLDGACTLAFHAKGPTDNPELDGTLVAKKARISLENGTRVTSSGAIQLSGTKKRPSVNGELEIHNGVIRVPEKSKELLPTDGDAVLWEEHASSFSRKDEPQVLEKVRDDHPTAGVSPQERDVDLDVTVTIPSGLWIRGQGMDVELAGELRLIQKGAHPTVAGELQAVGGRLVFLGRTFHVDRGRVVFYGGDEIDPSMDLVLSTNVEGTVVRILLGGTAHEPELRLASEPELPEGDIMSLLVFGRALDELDNEQLNLLGRRAADMAAAFGAAQLETRLSQQLGMDLVTIRRGSSQEGGTSLVIGKYLSPKVLLKYEQALEERARFFVNLEYFLTRHFRIETLIGHQNQSAIEFNWTKEY